MIVFLSELLILTDIKWHAYQARIFEFLAFSLDSLVIFNKQYSVCIVSRLFLSPKNSKTLAPRSKACLSNNGLPCKLHLFNNLNLLNFSQNKGWEKIDSMKEARGFSGSTLFNGGLWVTGGYNRINSSEILSGTDFIWGSGNV